MRTSFAILAKIHQKLSKIYRDCEQNNGSGAQTLKIIQTSVTPRKNKVKGTLFNSSFKA